MEQVFSLIPDGMYKELAQHNLNHFLRGFFEPLETLEQYDFLLAEGIKIRDKLNDFHAEMTKRIYEDVLINVPVRFIKDSKTRKGATYLRWRNVSNSKNGVEAWENIVTDPEQPKVLRDSLLQAEKERIALNMQMAVIVHMIRQLSECREKLAKVEPFTQMAV